MSEIKRKLATIERIIDLNPIEGADSIERATVRGWNVVVKKGEFKKGDLCIYLEIDSLVPERQEFEFLRPRGFRIRTVKLRGQVSQGIIFPTNILPMSVSWLESPDGLIVEIDKEIGFIDAIGADVTDVLGVTKYESPIPAQLAGEVKGMFPSHSIKTDEERIQNLIDKYESYKKESWVATEKLDGTSATYSIFNGVFGASSRNLELKENESNSYWKFAREVSLEEKMRKFMSDNGLEALTLQGELIGEGIQKNKYKLKGQTVRFFRAFDPVKYQFIPYERFIAMMSEMGLETVPILSLDFKLPETYEEAIAMADGQSALCETAREGIVFVAKNPLYDDNGRLSFKIISNKFLLKHEE